MKRESTLFKVLHVCVLNGLLAQVLLPASQALAAPSAFSPAAEIPAAISYGLGADALPQVGHQIAAAAAGACATAVAGGPGQTESSAFSLNTTSSMVNPFTGDFSYSIPLMDVEGYPIVISYNSNVGMLDEASWVGLGWNLNVGSVSREMRGIPDEFNGGQNITRQYSVLEDEVSDGYKVGVTGGISYKGVPASKRRPYGLGADLTLLFGSYKNTYTGTSKTFDFNIGASLTTPLNGRMDGVFSGLRGGLGYSSDSKNGVGRSTSVGLLSSYSESDGTTSFGQYGLSWGSNYHSRAGVTQRSLGTSVAYGMANKDFMLNVPMSFGATFTCGGATAVPRYELNSTTSASQWVVDGSVGFGKGNWRFSAGLEYQDYSNDQTLVYTNADTKTISSPAYGYFHAKKRDSYTGSGMPVMDFNRERDGQFSEDMKHLAYSFPTYDVFYVDGLGISATFRGIRNDIGVYRDPKGLAESEGAGKNVIAGINLPMLELVTGFVYNDQTGESTSGKWQQGAEYFQFGPDENVQFKGIGEPTPKSGALLDEVGGTAAAYLKLQKVEGVSTAINKTNQLVSASGTISLSSTDIANANVPEIRANIYKPVLAGDAGYLDDFEHVYPVNSVTPASTPFARIDGIHLNNHISAMEVVTSSGMKYTYGLPVYSIREDNFTFSTSHTDADAQGLVGYTSTEKSINNTSGGSHLFDKTTTPAYPTSFLLTGVTSSDYIDLTGNGYSIDDIGDYYKINYSRVYNEATPFKWRFPMTAAAAFFQEGLLATERDNTASFTYGEKEIWYTNSVESRNLIAEFIISGREDGAGVQGEDGTLHPTTGLKKLERIILYNRSERIRLQDGAVPLQVVEFTYDYSLCPNNPSNRDYNPSNPDVQPGTGKLTLKEIRVYTGPKSQETALHPYKMIYSEQNPAFHYKSVDRWGNYKADDDAAHPLELYPYAEQDTEEALNNVLAWKLTKLRLPSGSEMEVQYEADSYRYVQDQRAMELLDVKGYMTPFELARLLDDNTWNETDFIGNKLHKDQTGNIVSLTGGSSGLMALATNQANVLGLSGAVPPTVDLGLLRQKDLMPANVVVFELKPPISAGSKAAADELFREAYLKEDEKAPVGSGYMKEIYLRSFVEVKDGAPSELIPTFAKIKKDDFNLDAFFPGYGAHASSGVMPPNSSGQYAYGYIILENVLSSEDERKAIAMSPIQKTAMEFSRLHLTDIVYGSDPDSDGDLTIDKKVFWKGDLYKEMSKAGYAARVVENLPSQVRVFDHDNKKLGGNARVKTIILRDQWFEMSGEKEPGAEYYWKYFYDRSSYGVAAYEPASGNDENPLYRWDRYTVKSVSFPDESRFTVMPIGESLYPSPVVGYRQVELELDGNQHKPEIGYSVSTFKTAYEHPTIASSTGIARVKADKTSIFKEEIDLYGLTEGHSVITNNFHGQPEEYAIYNANGHVQSRTKYHYRAPGAPVNMIDRAGGVTSEVSAAEYDISADARFVVSKYGTTSVGLILMFPLPSFIPSGFIPVLNTSYREVGFYAHTLNKHIHYSASVESVETENLGSVQTAQDLAYDRETGSVLLASLTDEFDDELYSFSYPAHWYYSLLRSPLRQPTASISGTLTSGTFTASGLLTDKFTVGDLVSVTNGGTTVQAYVLNVSGSAIKLINAISPFTETTAISGSCSVKLLRSGRRNMLTATMEQVVTKRNPLGPSSITFPAADVLSASAMTLRPRLNAICRDYGGSEGISVVENAIINPFAYGLLNNYVPEHSYVPQLERNASSVQGIRFDGAYIDYYSFFALGSDGEWYRVNEANYPSPGPDATNLYNWRPMGRLTALDEYGRALESEDQIRVPSSVLYGYNRFNKLIPVAQAANARQHEIAFDSFDDYSYHASALPAVKGHFEFSEAILANPTNVAVTSLHRHSGLSSLSVNMGVTAQVSRPVTQNNCSPNFSFNGDEYQVSSCMCVKGFEPNTEKKYLISLWVKGSALDSGNNYTDVSAVVSYSGSGTTHTFTPAGPMLDGWQRIEGTFTIPAAATSIRVALKNTSAVSNTKVYFDDIRIHPFKAAMSTIVYNPQNLLPMATHDAYNYTTFYGYDENLAPVRVRVETINGIQTISESEGSTIIDFKD